MIEVGQDAIALNSTSNAQRLSEYLRANETNKGIIICLDNDKAGREASRTLSESFTDMNVDFFCSDICGSFKDPNEAFVADREKFRLTVEETAKQALTEFERLRRPDSATSYINTIMSDEIEELKKYRHLKTGYSNIDAIIGNLYPDLYVIGAISSLGKTTFCVQMADQIASIGTDVLFLVLNSQDLR